MSDLEDTPRTRATAAASALGIEHAVRVIQRAGSAAEAAARIGIPATNLLKTMVVRRAADDYLLVLVPGPAQIDWPSLRRHLGISRISMPDADTALAVTGYERGTITPLGAEGGWPVLADASIVGSGIVSIGGGRHGVAILADADDLLAALHADIAALIVADT